MINVLLGITTTIGNIVILIALHKETWLRFINLLKQLFRSPVPSDIFVAFVQLVYGPYVIAILQGQWQTCRLLSFVCSKEAKISLTVSVYDREYVKDRFELRTEIRYVKILS